MKVVYKAWLEQAQRDLKVAELCFRNGFYEWACFCYQEATVKITKAALKKLELESFRHSVFNLLETLKSKIDVPDEIFEFAKEIDRHYITARYPGANMLKPPYETYSQEDANKAKEYSNTIIEFLQRKVLNREG